MKELTYNEAQLGQMICEPGSTEPIAVIHGKDEHSIIIHRARDLDPITFAPSDFDRFKFALYGQEIAEKTASEKNEKLTAGKELARDWASSGYLDSEGLYGEPSAEQDLARDVDDEITSAIKQEREECAKAVEHISPSSAQIIRARE